MFTRCGVPQCRPQPTLRSTETEPMPGIPAPRHRSWDRSCRPLFQQWLRLNNPAAERARTLLAEKGFTEAQVAEWGVGYAPPTGTALTNALPTAPADVLTLTGPTATTHT